MRSIRLTALVILWLLASGPWVHANGRMLKKVVRPVRPPPAVQQRAHPPSGDPETYSPWTVEGWGETSKDAEQMALEHARREILNYFEQKSHRLEWWPSLEYINKNLIRQRVDIRADDVDEPVRQWPGVRLWIEIAPDKWHAMLQEDRRLRSELRMLLLFKLLAGVVAFLGAVAGYLRVEEMTKGYYTAWLRLVTIAFVVAVGVGILWIA